MVKDKAGSDDKFPRQMSKRDIVVKIMNLITQEGVSNKKLRKILDYVERVVSEAD